MITLELQSATREHGGLVGRWTAGQVRAIMAEARSRGWKGLRANKFTLAAKVVGRKYVKTVCQRARRQGYTSIRVERN